MENKVFFGEYPQAIKADGVEILDTTNEKGYLLGSDGAWYSRVVAKPFVEGYTFSNGKPVEKGEAYFFKVEPIRWRILFCEGDIALLLCDSIIANHRFDTKSSNYADSEIRKWLNNELYNIAFDDFQKGKIIDTLVDNSLESTGYLSCDFICEDTSDKIFLLSQSEITRLSYGFDGSYLTHDTHRQMTTSDYARGAGVRVCTESNLLGNGWWWLRSPYQAYRLDTRGVNPDGYANGGDLFYVKSDEVGVVPALRITLN